MTLDRLPGLGRCDGSIPVAESRTCRGFGQQISFDTVIAAVGTILGVGTQQLRVDAAPTLAFQSTERTPELLRLIVNDMRSELPIWTELVPILAEPFRQIEDDGLRKEVVFLRESDERLARLRLNVGRINYCELSAREPFAHDCMEQVERIAGSGLVVFVVCNESPTEIRRDNLRE